MSAKQQLEKEIREAIVFLRTKNQTIPSETIEFIKQASLEKLEQLSTPQSREYCYYHDEAQGRHLCTNPLRESSRCKIVCEYYKDKR